MRRGGQGPILVLQREVRIVTIRLAVLVQAGVHTVGAQEVPRKPLTHDGRVTMGGARRCPFDQLRIPLVDPSQLRILRDRVIAAQVVPRNPPDQVDLVGSKQAVGGRGALLIGGEFRMPRTGDRFSHAAGEQAGHATGDRQYGALRRHRG